MECDRREFFKLLGSLTTGEDKEITLEELAFQVDVNKKAINFHTQRFGRVDKSLFELRSRLNDYQRRNDWSDFRSPDEGEV
jgi:hypothetical protein